MRRRGGDGDGAGKQRQRDGAELHDATGAPRRRGDRAARRPSGPERLSRELAAAQEHEAAAAEVLGIISRSPQDAQPVFDAIVQSAARLCGAAFSVVQLLDGERLRLAATNNYPPEALAPTRPHQGGPDRSHPVGRAIVERRVVHVPDVLADPDYARELALAGGWRAVLAVPMLRAGQPVGAIAVARSEPVAFSERQVRLLGMFADQAVIALENARRFEELEARTREVTEALEHQTAITDVLDIISRSPSDVQPVFDAIVQCASRLCGAEFSAVTRFDGGLLHLAAVSNMSPEETAAYNTVFPRPPDRGFVVGRAFLEGAPVQVEDVSADPDYDPRTLAILQRAAPYRSYLGIPIIRDGAPIGAIGLGRRKVLPFSPRQIELVQTFANQAVIAIENAKLFAQLEARNRELNEALQQQTATAEVLKTISNTAFDLDAVLLTLVKSALDLCHAVRGHILLRKGDVFHLAMQIGGTARFEEYIRQNPIRPGRGSVTGRVALTGAVAHVRDVLADPEYTLGEGQKIGDYRTVLGVPLLRDANVVGVFVLSRGTSVAPFSEREIQLVQSFSDQAVIALENVRLFDELKARTDDLGKALEQQVATGEILRVIASSPTDITPVLNAVAESAARLCGAVDAQIFRVEADSLCLAASFGPIPVHFRKRAIDRSWVTGRAAVDRRTIHIPDLAAESETEYPAGKEMQRQHGHRTTLATPLLRQGAVLGAILIRRLEVNPYTEDQIRLLEAFADQAVIAIENVRLFDEVRARTRELTEALEQQTATSAILRVISTSPTDVQPVFEAMAHNAVVLCGSLFANVFRFDGELLHFVTSHNVGPGYMELLRAKYPMRPDSSQVSGRAVLTRSVVRLEDALADRDYDQEFPTAMSWRRMLGVPMLRHGEPLGVIVVGWAEAGPVPKAQEELLKQFADQAVIAIENARLLKELRESLQQQTATADVLKAISRATFDLPTVLKTLVEAAARLCGADQGTIAREQAGVFRRVASHGFSERFNELIRTLPVTRERGSATGRALAEGRVVHIPDVQCDPDYTFLAGRELGGFRTILAVPMLRAGVAIGVLALTRKEVRPFDEKQIELVATFADQAAIAIENVRLFEAAEARTRELARSLEDLRTAQDRLVQTEKLASLGQLTAGIAHEIKNPLNFVNNFAAVSTELVEELQQALAGVRLEGGAAEEVAELSQMLRGNLDKIVQHGRRADSIVKNMLLHARQGSGEHRRVDINAIVEESLNLAYHGARAERQGFNITLERAFDPAAGEVDVFPQEITRVLLNLISNGFYAALKRKAGSGGQDYEPTLKAATRNLGDRVEITIRDNGTGIPAEVKEQLFRPFFTTKPVGEGTGLGLSISHDIVVKQHAGLVEVETRPGEFTEFRIILPRAAAGLGGGVPA